MRLESWQVAAFIFPFLVLLHLYVAPYTKVEESFNIQATHDILGYGVPTQNVLRRFKAQFDHMEFPGAVPRTFLGALMLSGVAKPFVYVFHLSLQNQQLLGMSLK
jgi:alpha-1,6-mannosyltransferase